MAGEPNSIFFELFLKSIKIKKIKNPLILIASEKLLKRQMKYLKFKKKIKILNPYNLKNYKLNNNYINLINVNYTQKKTFEKISKKSKNYIKKSFEIAFEILKSKYTDKFINGPISKRNFLDKKYPGITEFISKKFDIKNCAMLIYNKNLSVCPITTHIPIKNVTNQIIEKNIYNKAYLIKNFYINKFKINPKIAVLGLNPHCESVNKFNEDEAIIKPAIKYLKNKKIKISGPYPADTLFLKDNRKKFDVVIGMYHDQVLTPIKTLFEYDAINITLGLPFTRISPDHGPNEKMIGKNKSNPLSLIQAIKFLEEN